ncbi:MAG: aspartate/glutamate racemase family protein [Verrucomicrobiota bacterium]
MKTLLSLLLATTTFALAADLVQHAGEHPQGDAAYSFDIAVLRMDTRDLPIGVFDSGIGGLTVLEAILTIDAFNNDTLQPGTDGKPDFANERFQYFGDQANMPYGNYSSAGRTDYLRELIVKDALFLLGKRWHDPETKMFRQDKPPVKALVIACNTATAYGIEDIRAALKAWDVPVFVVGVVEAGARGVQNAHKEGAVGVLATVGTCASGAYPRVIGQTLGLAGRSIPAITQQGSANLAGVIEGDPAFKESVDERCDLDVRALVEAHRQSGATTPLSTVVLGCTHFPLVQAEIDHAFAALRKDAALEKLIAPKIEYVNPAEWTARELLRELATAKIRAKEAPTAKDSFYLSIPNPQRNDIPLTADGGLAKDFKYSRSPGELDREDTVNVPMTPARIPSATRKLIETKLPEVWQRLGK